MKYFISNRILYDFLENLYNSETTPKKKVEDLIHLAELCIDLLQQNEEHHSEVSLILLLSYFDFAIFSVKYISFLIHLKLYSIQS